MIAHLKDRGMFVEAKGFYIKEIENDCGLTHKELVIIREDDATRTRESMLISAYEEVVIYSDDYNIKVTNKKEAIRTLSIDIETNGLDETISKACILKETLKDVCELINSLQWTK